MTVRIEAEGLDKFLRAARSLSTRLDDVVEAAMKEVADHLAARSAALAPIDKGPLEKSLKGEVAGSSRSKTTVVVSSDLSYALKMHEHLTPFGPFNLGPKSRKKNQNPPPEGQVGGKYIERALNHNLRGYQSFIRRQVARNLLNVARRRNISIEPLNPEQAL